MVGEEEQEAILWGKSGVSFTGCHLKDGGCLGATSDILPPSASNVNAKSQDQRQQADMQGVLAGVPFFTEIFKYAECS